MHTILFLWIDRDFLQFFERSVPISITFDNLFGACSLKVIYIANLIYTDKTFGR